MAQKLLPQLEKLIKNMGITKPIEILEALNYKILWNGINPKKALITK